MMTMAGSGTPAQGLRVGAASTLITPVAGLEMGGYIARAAPASGVLDDLRCQAVVFGDGTTRLALAVCDLLYMTEPIRERACALLRQRAGFAGHEVMLTATHTHCGPAHLASPAHRDLQSYLAGQIADAVCLAADAAQPARLLTASAEVGLMSANRRDPAGPHDQTAQIVVAEPTGKAGGGAIAVLVNFPCHPTVLEHDTCRYSADFPGAMRQLVESVCGGTAVFLQGCAGDINPVFTEHTPAERTRAGALLGTACAHHALAVSRQQAGARVINLSLGTEPPVTGQSAGRPVAPAPLRAGLARVPVTARQRPPHDAVRRELDSLRTALAGETDPLVLARRKPREAELWIEDLLVTQAQRFDGTDPPVRPPGEDTLPVQVFRLGADLAIAALPGEPFTGTARQIRAGIPGAVLVAGYANHAAGYLPAREEFGHSGYEVGSSQYAPGTAERLASAAVALLGDLS
jgi:hypothetical protein